MLEERMNDGTRENLSRRDFLVKAGALTAGMAVAGGIFGTIAAENAEAALQNLNGYLPMTKKIDVLAVKKAAYAAYFADGGCCIGAAKGLISVIAANEGGAWADIPTNIFKFGAGGVFGNVKGEWGTLCGALNGASYAAGMVLPFDKATFTASPMTKFVDTLYNWYCRYPFPSNSLNVWIEANYSAHKDYLNQITTISKSPLCHASVSIYAKANATDPNTTKKKVRCAKLTADVAGLTAALLNKWYDCGSDQTTRTANYLTTAIANFSGSTALCMECHSTGSVLPYYQQKDAAVAGDPYADRINVHKTATQKRDNEQGKAYCGSCHDEKHSTATHEGWTQDCFTCHPKRY